jgi:hypothetical protein
MYKCKNSKYLNFIKEKEKSQFQKYTTFHWTIFRTSMEIELKEMKSNPSINEEYEPLNKEKKPSLMSKILTFANFLYTNCENQIIQTYNEMMNRKINFFLGILSCLVVVCMVAVAFTTVGIFNFLNPTGHLPRIFLRLAELSGGEFDIKIDLLGHMTGTVMNHTMISKKPIFQEGELSYHAPRFRQRLDTFAGNSPCLLIL